MKILLIEDENALAESILQYLREQEMKCEYANTIQVALEKINLYHYDCILLDLMLQNSNGFEVLEELKKLNKTEGVIIISAKQNLETRLEGFSLGADDYLIKPFHLAELSARIQALIRRKKFEGKNIVNFQEIELDIQSKTVKVKGIAIDTTKKEMELLLFLIGNQNKVLSKNVLAEHLSGDMADMLDNFDFVYAHIKNLKKKLKEAGAQDYIKTVYGLGYKWQND